MPVYHLVEDIAGFVPNRTDADTRRRAGRPGAATQRRIGSTVRVVPERPVDRVARHRDDTRVVKAGGTRSRVATTLLVGGRLLPVVTVAAVAWSRLTRDSWAGAPLDDAGFSTAWQPNLAMALCVVLGFALPFVVLPVGSSALATGKGDRLSLESSPHGAGRNHSRSAARRLFTHEQLREAMAGIEFRDTDAFIDEIPAAYKDVERVMADAADLVEVRHTLRQILNVKGD